MSQTVLDVVRPSRSLTEDIVATRLGGDHAKIAGWGSYTPHPVHPSGVGVQHPAALPMKFHDGGGGVMTGYHHHNLMDMYPGPAINTMDWKNTSQVGTVGSDHEQHVKVENSHLKRQSGPTSL